jgi:hypothetical protein
VLPVAGGADGSSGMGLVFLLLATLGAVASIGGAWKLSRRSRG